MTKSAVNHPDSQRSGVRWPIPEAARKTNLTIHIVAAVSLFGNTLAVVVMSSMLSTAPAADAAVANVYLSELGALVAAPLSLITILTGIVNGLATKHGVLRSGWVIAKFLLLVVAIVAGVAAPISAPLLPMAQCAVLLAAASLAVFKPGERAG